MKNIKKILEAQLKEVEEQFSQFEQRRQGIIQSSQKLQTELNAILTEMARLQGEHRRITKLQTDFQDEPKEK